MASGTILKSITNWYTIFNATCAFKASDFLPMKTSNNNDAKFTIVKPSLARFEAQYNVTRPLALGVKAGTGDANQLIGGSWIDPTQLTGKWTGLAFTVMLDVGTYYLWGKSSSDGNNTCVVRILDFK